MIKRLRLLYTFILLCHKSIIQLRLDLCTSIRLRCQVFFFQLAADPDMNVKNGAELLDRLVKVG